MLISRTTSSDIELPVLTSPGSFQPPPPERVPFSSPVSETTVDGIEPPTPAYLPPMNGIPPMPSFDAGLLEYTRVHGHSDIPLSPTQRENDRTSVHTSQVDHDAEALPVYRKDNPPNYFRSRHDTLEPMTWPTICFRLGFVFPFFWLCGALALITPQGSIERIFSPLIQDFAPSLNSWCDNLETQAEKEAYLARMRIAEKRWARMCLVALCVLLCLVIALVVTVIEVSRIH